MFFFIDMLVLSVEYFGVETNLAAIKKQIVYIDRMSSNPDDQMSILDDIGDNDDDIGEDDDDEIWWKSQISSWLS